VQAVVPAPDGGYPGGNTAEGQNALLSLTTGGFNTAVGFLSLRSDTTAGLNTAIGAGALLANTADDNTATGAGTLFSNTTGVGNTADGALALFKNTEGNFNTAIGLQALENSTASGNTAIGNGALFGNTTGTNNTAIGFQALFQSTTGIFNVAMGFFAGSNVTTASSVICIGSAGLNIDHTCFIGNIRGVTTGNADAIPVLVDSFGQLGTASSSARFKKEIKAMDKVSEAILALKPVTFHYKSDKTDTPQFGLIAEEVAKVNPDLVVHDTNGEIYTVRYDAVSVMLLNEFLKEHKKTEKLEATVASLIATVKDQASQIRKVSAQLAAASPSRGGLEASKPAPQVVNNP
jgi:hypothetical protein